MEWVPEGTVTSPAGFLAGATYAGLKTYGQNKLDLGVLVSERPSSVAGVFTTNVIRSASVVLSQLRVASGSARAVVVNSGCANACVGDQGMKDAVETTALAAIQLGLPSREVLFCSTGIIGVELPMALIRGGLPKVQLSSGGGHGLARAMMTTDTHPKEVAVTFYLGDKKVTLGGVCKGSGMIHPNMATMLCLLATDAAVDPQFLQRALKTSVDLSFNQVTVDGDTSTNDSLILLANGVAGNPPLTADSPDADTFQIALNNVCVFLARELAGDGEGATKLITVMVEGAASVLDARLAARVVAGSALVRTAVHGNDPNWGRVLAALGRSGAQVEERKVALFVNQICIMEGGAPIPFFKEAVVAAMNTPEVVFRLSLGLGDGEASAWSCDLTEEYVTINSAYTT
ncbi:MAG: bifunctional glutamate N-acetyltransferase/amino-acid acetyltransferase ArgJ [Dehalococcoidia bacterium]|nr:bifunctional glutamate N-acetyltransferase/amino-acid acetyltransferase ArgJ [Dehalococcoidia bacterium]